MIRNYIKSAFRSLTKNKGFTVLNVLGLSVGIATCLFIVLYLADELSYDKYNINVDRIYRVNEDVKFGGNTYAYSSCPAPVASSLKADFPIIKNTVRFRKSNEQFRIKKGDENIRENNVIYADATLFDVFTLPMIDGSPSTALVEPHSVVITERTAKKYFNKINVVGQIFLFNDSINYKITGVIKDIPRQSHFNFDFFLSMSSLADSRETSWLGGGFITYILFKPASNYSSFENNFPKIVNKYVAPQLQSDMHTSISDFEEGGSYIKFNLSPLASIHLQSNRVGELGHNSNIQYIYIFSAIAIFILLIACINFVNLSTARFSNRAREVGVRKVLGSSRKHLVIQFLTESVLVTFVSAIIALILAYILLPLFNEVAGKDLSFAAHSLIWLFPLLVIVVIIIGVLAGSYPAFFLSAFQPVKVLKGKLSEGFKGGGLRSFLVVFQFSISIFLIIGTLVIYNQLHYIQAKNLGYDRNQVLIIQNVKTLGSKAKILKNDLKQLPGVINATMTAYLPTGEDRNSHSLFPDASFDLKKAILTQYWPVDEDYISTLGIKMESGRNFSSQFATDSSAIIVNEAFAKLLGFKDPLNRKIFKNTANDARHIIGVMKDFHFNSLREKITPVVLFYGEDRGAISLKINATDLPALMSQIKDKWKALAPNQQFNYSFMDNDFDAAYRSEQRVGQIFITFSTLAILIACLGLFGLAAYAAEQRNKEISIRKILGASVSGIIGMLSVDFIKLVFISIAIASPIAWFIMNMWLQGFAYRENPQWWIWAMAGSVAILIAFLTISTQAIKAAVANPVKSLRSE